MTLRVMMLVVIANLATAKPAFAVDKEAAKQAYEEGRRRYDLNEFEAALEAFKRAYLAFEDPVFLFNIAQCHRQLRNNDEAIRFYRSYLRNLPEAPNSDEVKSIVAKLQMEVAEQRQAQLRAQQSAAAAAPANVPASPPIVTVATAAPTSHSRPVYKKWWLWTIVGVVAAGAATGLAVAVTSQRTENSLMPLTVVR